MCKDADRQMNWLTTSRRSFLRALGAASFASKKGYLRPALPQRCRRLRSGASPCGSCTPQVLVRINAHLPLHFEIVQQFDRPVIPAAKRTPGRCMEGGVALKVGGIYRIFTCEFKHSDINGSTNLVYWTSRDLNHWNFQSTVLRSTPSANCGKAHALWEPTPIFDQRVGRWYLFFVAYDQKGCGQIRMMAATERGYDRGLDGPWRDVGAIMRPGTESQPWEGSQGVDSFYPYPALGRWFAMYGSSSNVVGRKIPHAERWQIGLASAPTLRGPWTRCQKGNPLPVEKIYWENPIVRRINGWYVAVYDAVAPGAQTYIPNGGHIAGYTCSRDGIHWLPGGRILVQPTGPANWSRDLRTPMGLIPEGNGVYTMFYTGFDRSTPEWTGYESVGVVRLRVVWHSRRTDEAQSAENGV